MFTWSWSRKKYLEPEPRKDGSAPQHWWCLGTYPKVCFIFQAVNLHCFPAFLSIPPQQFKLVLDSIIWAFKHTMRNVADTGLNILKQLLQVSTKWGGGGGGVEGDRVLHHAIAHQCVSDPHKFRIQSYFRHFFPTGSASSVLIWNPEASYCAVPDQ